MIMRNIPKGKGAPDFPQGPSSSATNGRYHNSGAVDEKQDDVYWQSKFYDIEVDVVEVVYCVPSRL